MVGRAGALEVGRRSCLSLLALQLDNQKAKDSHSVKLGTYLGRYMHRYVPCTSAGYIYCATLKAT